MYRDPVSELPHRDWVLVIASRSSLILSDMLLIYITWTALYKRSKVLPERHSLSYILLRDGSAYFMCLLTLNTLQLVFTIVSVATIPVEATSYITAFIDPVTALLMSRFMLDLQAVDQRSRALHSARTHTSFADETPHPSAGRAGNDSLVFHRVVGSIGSCLVDEQGRAHEYADGEERSGRDDAAMQTEEGGFSGATSIRAVKCGEMEK
ncbi:hypothetical protein C8Q76DRAFT_325861 [Earliella scabrosa]|nr:hypothetical protein C8Q76DRAFT_325861 [Earliella scabrosa]